MKRRLAEEIVPATELARNTARVLRRAFARPIVVTHPKGNLTLTDRAAWVDAREAQESGEMHVETLSDLLRAFAVMLDDEPATAYPRRLRWVGRLEPEDRRAFVDEIAHLVGAVETGAGNWDEFDAALYEWEASVAADSDENVRAAIQHH